MNVPNLGEYNYPYPLNPSIKGNLKQTGGILIEIEGLDGSGKSSQLELIRKKLEEKYKKVYIGNFIHSEYIKDILLRTKYENCDGYTFALMYTMGLSHFFNMEIKNRLENGYIVILDRYVDTIESKAIAKGVSRIWIKRILSIFRKPDINIFIDVPPNICLERKTNDNKMLSYWECGCDIINDDDNRMHYNPAKYKENFIIHQTKMRKIFLNEIKSEKIIIDGSKSISRVNKEIMDHIYKKIGDYDER